jgi:putative phosphoribosyl transferase
MMHAPFEDRLWAGRYLAAKLASVGVPHDGIVMALARSGVPVGYEVADRLHRALDVEAARRIAIPWQPEITIGAVVGDEAVLDDPLIKGLNLSDSEVAEILQDEIESLALENDEYHRHSPRLELEGHPVILVDDGLETGDTMLAAVRHMRRFRPRLVIAAAPVGPEHAFARLRNEADNVVWLEAPKCFQTIGEHFCRFDEVTDVEIEKLLMSNRRQFDRTERTNHNSSCCVLSPMPRGAPAKSC